jgi:DNA-binding NtrC family response regulator
MPYPLLLVDDDPVLRETLTVLLQNEGFKVGVAASGEEAEGILKAARPPFNLVLTDLVMPGKSGMDVLAKALELNPTSTVLLLTGFGSVREATEAMDKGAYGLVNKPLQLDQFRNILRRIMERILLIDERNALKSKVHELQERVESLEARQGRMEILAGRISTLGGGEPGSEALGDLERLADLKGRGLLSEEQFENAKRALLARWMK